MLRDRLNDAGLWTNFNPQTDVVLVRFRFTHKKNDVPVRILVFDANDIATEHDVNFEKRDGEGVKSPRDMSHDEFMRWASSVRMDDLVANYAGVRQIPIHHNATTVSALRSVDMGLRLWWDASFEDAGPGPVNNLSSPASAVRAWAGSSFGNVSSINTAPDIMDDDDDNNNENNRVTDTLRVRGREMFRPSPQAGSARHKRVLAVSNDTDPTTMPLVKSATVGRAGTGTQDGRGRHRRVGPAQPGAVREPGPEPVQAEARDGRGQQAEDATAGGGR